MLFALAHPASLGVLAVSFVVGMGLHGWVQAWVADRFGDRRVRLERRLTADPRPHLEPFGVVAALLSGLGWVKPVEPPVRRTRAGLLAVTLSGPATNVALGVALLLAWRWTFGPAPALLGGASSVLQRGAALGDAPGVLLLLAGASQLYLGVLSLVPLPPLDGGRLMFGLAPRTQGWLKAEHQLVERNIGVVVLLALLLLPIGGQTPALPQLLDTLLTPVLGLLVGGG